MLIILWRHYNSLFYNYGVKTNQSYSPFLPKIVNKNRIEYIIHCIIWAMGKKRECGSAGCGSETRKKLEKSGKSHAFY